MPRRKYQYIKPPFRPQNNIRLERGIFESLSEIKDKYGIELTHAKEVKNPIGWGDFLLQMALYMDADRHTQSVRAVRFNRWAYFSVCPECGREKSPLLCRYALIWKVECPGCGIEYIAKA